MEICFRDRSFFVARVGRKTLLQDNFFCKDPFPLPDLKNVNWPRLV